MRTISLRARVAAAAAVAIVVAVGLLAVAVPALLERQLSGELDRSLRGRAVEVARLEPPTRVRKVLRLLPSPPRR